MSSVRQFKKWLFGSRQVQVQIVGAEFAGKSTLLYTLKNSGGAPKATPNPSTDYNRELIEYPIGWEFDIVEVWEGCSKFINKNGPFHFMTSETVVWYVHDCSVPLSMMWIKEYVQAMEKRGAKYLWVILSQQDKLPVEGNERANAVAKHKKALLDYLQEAAASAGITWFVVDEPGFNAQEGAKYVLPFVKGVTRTLLDVEPARYGGQRVAKKSLDEAAGTQQSLALQQGALGHDALVRVRFEQVEKGEGTALRDVGLFWENFMQVRLTSWSHVDHLEAGYLVLLRSMERKHGLLKTASTFLEHLARLREARPDIFRNTAHFTMTAFWIIQLRIAVFNYQFEVKEDTAVPVDQDFRGVLLHSPSLLDTRLWMEYYSKEVLFAPHAREDFVMPDIKPFPQVTKTVLASLVEKEVSGDDGRLETIRSG